MNKNEILALFEACRREAEYALTRSDLILTDEERKNLERKYRNILNYQNSLSRIADTNAIEREMIQTYKELKQINLGNTASLKKDYTLDMIKYEPNKGKLKVQEVIPESKQKESTIKERDKLTETLKKVCLGLGIAALVAIIACAVTYLVNNADFKNKTENELIDELKVKPIDELDIENNEALANYAANIQEALEDTNLSIDDIMYAIRLANFDYLENRDYFYDREGVCRSTYNIGEITTKLGSDSIIKKEKESDIFLSEAEMKDILLTVTDNKLSLENFEFAKKEQGYDVYSVVDKCIEGMNRHEENDMQYAMVFNDIVSRATRNFTIVEDSPVQTMYSLLGMYNANHDRIVELTAGRLLGPIYGNGARIDGTYGDICVEELVKATYIAKDKGQYVGADGCIFYNDFADEIIITPSMGSR